jgi:hypothetical protein
MEAVSSELIEVMTSKEKEGGRAISVPLRHCKAGLYSKIMTSNIEPRLYQHSSALATCVKYWRANVP